MIEKICPTCGTTFSCKSKLQVYCSKNVKRKFNINESKIKNMLQKLDNTVKFVGKK